ncbi:carbohydrate kinase family protein [Devosia rhodophyticola]|uniref:Carbohydrate kinase family protein n=1 Tax=Devosia rhodophyticola TaxID=3026423 RepID=A0ABY7YZQ1_9HYPH|nr:carbohydrate kinase family protein [Devosia rhodophyticola]WDR06824.1 carbohydrate kinase family protein [Devosia rhodophyticola]
MQIGSHNCDVLIAGEYYCDLLFAGLDGVPQLGTEKFASSLMIAPGGTYNMALGLTRLGVDTRWVCDFGTDMFSQHVLERAKLDRIDPSAFTLRDHPVSRLTAAFSAAGDRGFISYCDPPVMPPDRVDACQIRPKWLLQTFRFEPAWLDFIEGVKSAGAKVFADCRGGRFSLDTPAIRTFLKMTDVFSPNADEAKMLTGADTAEDAIKILAQFTPVVALKDGRNGVLLSANGEVSRVQGIPVDVADTVGAGDAFNAGYLYGVLRNLSPALAAEAGNLCGAYSATVAGGSSSPQTRDLMLFAQSRSLRYAPEIADILTAQSVRTTHSNEYNYPEEG